MSQCRARPIRIVDSMASALITGSAPGRPRQTGQVWVLGSAPNVVSQPQNILLAVPSSTCVSRPMTGSYSCSASAYGTVMSPSVVAVFAKSRWAIR